MVHGLRITWPQICGNHPSVFGEIHFDENALVVDGTGRGKLNILWHLDHHVRLEPPAFLEVTGAGLSVSLPSAAPPSAQATMVWIVGLAESLVVGEVTVCRIGEPRRHLARQNSRLHGFRPGPRVFVGQKRHGRDFTGRWQV